MSDGAAGTSIICGSQLNQFYPIHMKQFYRKRFVLLAILLLATGASYGHSNEGDPRASNTESPKSAETTANNVAPNEAPMAPATCVTPTVNTAPTSDVDCNGASTGSANATASNGLSPYTFIWSNGQTTQSISNLPAGMYTVTVTEGGGCTASGSVVISEPTALQATGTTTTDESCAGGDGTATALGLGGTGTPSYLWSTGATNASINGLTAGTYTVTIQDANGCTAVDNAVSIGTTTGPTVTFSPYLNIECHGGTTLVTGGSSTGTTPYTYTWSSGASSSSENLPAGTHTLTVTDASGCTASDSLTLTQPATPYVATITVNSQPSCTGVSDGDITVTTTGGVGGETYAWHNAQVSANNPTATNGFNTVTVTDANGCIATAIVELIPVGISPNAVVDSNATCHNSGDGGVSASPTGGTSPYTYLWTYGTTTQAVQNTTWGDYIVTVTDSNGCSAIDTATVTHGPPVGITLQVDSHVTCSGEQNGGVSVQITGGYPPYDIQWLSGDTTATRTGLIAGWYQVYVTDVHNCTSNSSTNWDSIQVYEPFPMLVTATADSLSQCPGDLIAGATANVTGGLSPYTYSWDNGATTQSITGVAGTTYSVSITDDNGCTSGGGVDLSALCVNPTGRNERFIQDTTVWLLWDTLCGAQAYRVFYRQVGTQPWTIVQRNGNLGFLFLTGLTPDTRYMWRIQVKCANGNWTTLSNSRLVKTLLTPCNIDNNSPSLVAAPVFSHQARVNWAPVPDASRYKVRWRQQGGSWTYRLKDAVKNHHWLAGLSAGTTYEWQVKVYCSGSNGSGSKWSSLQTFVAPVLKTAFENSADRDATLEVFLFPNPASEQATIVLSQQVAATVRIMSASGAVVSNNRFEAANQTQLNLQHLSAGLYIVEVVTELGTTHERLVVR